MLVEFNPALAALLGVNSRSTRTKKVEIAIETMKRNQNGDSENDGDVDIENKGPNADATQFMPRVLVNANSSLDARELMVKKKEAEVAKAQKNIESERQKIATATRVNLPCHFICNIIYILYTS
jgi:hypothetical protein